MAALAPKHQVRSLSTSTLGTAGEHRTRAAAATHQGARRATAARQGRAALVAEQAVVRVVHMRGVVPAGQGSLFGNDAL